MFYRLPPVGHHIVVKTDGDAREKLAARFAPSIPFYFDSGAAALAAVLKIIVSRAGRADPEVLLPAYTCPELVSAVLFAGARPVLVDLEQERPWLDLHDLAGKLSERSVAIIAVALFGIPERLALIRELIRNTPIRLIEDNAQCVPEHRGNTTGHVTIYSFGRGKPVSVLGGGMALVNDENLARIMADFTAGLAQDGASALHTGLRICLYNLLLHPRLYWLPYSLPFLHLGETRFRPLEQIMQMNAHLLSWLPSNMPVAEQPLTDRQSVVKSMLAELPDGCFIDLAATTCGEQVPRLLRYPVLAQSAALRDKAYHQLDAQGLGVSKMYPAVLPQIAGMGTVLGDQGRCAAAEDFAARLLTLPVHEGMKPRHVQAIKEVLLRVGQG